MKLKIRALVTATALTCLTLPTSAECKPTGTQAGTMDQSQSELRWSNANRTALQSALAKRDRHGLDHVTFIPGGFDQGSNATVENVYDRAAMDYARALAQGSTDPSTLHEVYTIARPTADLRRQLTNALRNETLGPWLDGLPPNDDEYRQLSIAYLAANGTTETQAPKMTLTESIHVGDTNPGIAAIVQQLTADGYLANTVTDAASKLYSQGVADAVKALQRDYGLREDGIIGRNTLGVLTLRPGDRARTLAVGLERRRWLSRTPPATRIDVNTAAAELSYFRDGTLVDRRKVIVGEPDRETPGLGSPIYRLVANPTWTVPKSISVSSSTVRAKNMHRVNGYWVQPSGPDNALGLVKFDMRNNQAIYLHDTAAPELFDRSQRHLSHGCVRVADALGFARMLADQEGVGDAWTTAHESGNYKIVDLPREIPVRLLYHNAFVAGDGTVSIRTDPYGWNDAIATDLGFKDAKTRHAKAEAIDIGP